MDNLDHVASQVFMDRCLDAVALALLYYDYLLTVPLEIERIWLQNKANWNTVLFFAIRYLTVFGHVPVIVQSFWLDRPPIL